MKNQFDSENYPDREPDQLVVGERWAWKRPDIAAAYPTATFTLKYRFSIQNATGTVTEITATKSGSAHVVEVSQTDTSGYAAGDYFWQAVIIRDADSEEVVVDSGYWELQPNLDEAVDTRSHNYITLMAIRAVIEQTATKEQASYSVAGRSLSRRNLEELMELEREYLRRWQNEKKEKRRQSGRKIGNRVLAKLSA